MEAFGEGNGVRSLSEMRERIAKVQTRTHRTHGEPKDWLHTLGRTILFSRSQNGFWYPRISVLILSREKDTTAKTEAPVRPCGERSPKDWPTRTTANLDPGQQLSQAVQSIRYGEPMVVSTATGQGTFRVIVTDAYERRCAITGERTLPVLEAAHIKALQLGRSA